MGIINPGGVDTNIGEADIRENRSPFLGTEEIHARPNLIGPDVALKTIGVCVVGRPAFNPMLQGVYLVVYLQEQAASRPKRSDGKAKDILIHGRIKNAENDIANHNGVIQPTHSMDRISA